jgi:hypothetical protein
MSIKLGDNIQVQIPKPLDSKYLNDTFTYTGTSQVNSCIASGLRHIGLTVNISNVEYWYNGGILDSCLVIKSAGSIWGSITGTISSQTDLQTCLNSKLASGGTAVCATSAIDSKALCGCTPSCFLGATACAADSAKLENHLPAYFQSALTGTGFVKSTAGTISYDTNMYVTGTPWTALGYITSVALTPYVLQTAINTLSGTTLPANYYNKTQINTYSGATNTLISNRLLTSVYSTYTGTTLTLINGKLGATACAVDSAKLGNHLPAYYLGSGGTSINSLALCGCVPSCFLGATVCAVDSAKLNNKLSTYYLNTGSTAVCATSAIDSKGLCGCTPSCFLGATACATDSNKLNDHIAAYYLTSGGTAINSLALCGCIPSCFLGATGTATMCNISN